MPKANKVQSTFSAHVYENLGTVNETITRARVRIFYKGLNRNGTYISDSFAESLLATLPYTPIKGIYDDIDEDFIDHGDARDEGRIYGVVPADNNVSFEDHEDPDGVTRTYACSDVLLWTALYTEANQIVGSSQSMELYAPSIKGSWKIIGDKRVYEYTEGCFLGLQALGEDVEPCFEGASFYTMFTQFSLMYEKLGMKVPTIPTGGKDEMEDQKHPAEETVDETAATEESAEEVTPEVTPETIEETTPEPTEEATPETDEEPATEEESSTEFRLSDYQKGNKIASLLNATEWRYYVVDTYDNFAIVRDCEDEKFVKVEFTKEGDEVTLGSMTEVYAEFVTKEELASLETLRAIGGTYSLTAEKFSEQGTKIEEQSATIATLTSEKETAEQTIAQLNEYKVASETAEKTEVCDKYAEILDEEIVAKYKENLSEYSVIELEKELSYEFVQSKAETMFSHKDAAYIPNDIAPTGLEAILDKYKNNKTTGGFINGY